MSQIGQSRICGASLFNRNFWDAPESCFLREIYPKTGVQYRLGGAGCFGSCSSGLRRIMRCGNMIVELSKGPSGRLDGLCSRHFSSFAYKATKCLKSVLTGRPQLVPTSLERALPTGSNPVAGFGALLVCLAPLFFVAMPAAMAADGGNRLGNFKQPQAADRGSFHIGTFQTHPGEAPGGFDTPSIRGGLRHEDFSGDSLADDLGLSDAALESPNELLSIALSELKANQRVRARRCLELLVARFPNSAAADTARGHLGKLYAHNHENLSHRLRNTAGLDIDRVHEGAKKPRLLHDVNRDMRAPPMPAVSGPLSRALGLAVGDRVFFAPDSYKLGSKAAKVLRAQAKWLERRAGLTILVSGYADEPGGAERNFALSQRRAQSVMDRLIKEGVAKRRIRVLAFGKRSPIATCSSPVCAAQNRRVVTRILKDPLAHAELKVRVRSSK